MLKNSLLQLGLDEKEAGIYLASLELGPCSIQDIAKKSGIKRSTIYGIISDLKTRGLFNETIKGKKRLFIASNPETLSSLIDRQRTLLDKILPELRGISNAELGKPKVRFYETLEEIRSAYIDSISGNDQEILSITSAESGLNFLGPEWIASYIRTRIERGIHIRAIIDSSPTSLQVFSTDKESLRQTKILPSNKHFVTDIEIYGNKVLITSFEKEHWAVVIESETISSMMKMVFAIMWDSLSTPHKK
ncbi:MAG: Transcriptional regulator, TrmB [Candidatus Wolfebacteria bacterium GW2011_GWE1_48_7]|nr:MAG: Transcriptional regulator, TrmB [Candidatus Wolfebacteria bacterium GW2011_GWE1_48_7]HBT75087.1 hypothetical protein [Candidatus Wolfebacteria bacterium]